MGTLVHLTLDALRLAAGLLAGLAIAYQAAALLAFCRFRRRRPPRLDAAPPVSILKPLAGLEPRLEASLVTFLRQDYPGPIQTVFGVRDPVDPALAVARRLRRRLPAADIAITCGGTTPGIANRKIANLMTMMPAVRHDLLLLADSDIGVSPDYLRTVVACLRQPDVGCVTCAFHGRPVRGFWSRLEASGTDWHFLPSVTMADLLGMGDGCFGATIALRRETLNAVGGFARFKDRLADDHALGKAVRELGFQIMLAPVLVGHVARAPTLRRLWRHELRWARTIRLLQPWGHAGTLVTHALPLALAFVLLDAASRASLALLAAACIARLALVVGIDRALGADPRRAALLPVRDLLSFGVFLASFLGRDVVWRGRRHAVGPAGLMLQDEEAPR